MFSDSQCCEAAFFRVFYEVYVTQSSAQDCIYFVFAKKGIFLADFGCFLFDDFLNIDRIRLRKETKGVEQSLNSYAKKDERIRAFAY